MAGLFASEKAIGFARVVVERGVDRYPDGLTYAITADNAKLQPGDRVIVPLGKGDSRTAGYILDIVAQTDLDADLVKPVLKRDDSTARLPEQLLSLAKWISNYYCAPIGMTLGSMLPAAVKRNVGAVRRTMVDFGDPIPLDEKLPAKQRAVLEALAKLPEHERPVEVRRLAQLAGLQTTGSIKKLIERGLLEVSKRTSVEAAWIEQALDARAPDSLTVEQQRIVDAIEPRLDSGFSTHLLYGVTGSGKTEVYIQLIRRVVDAGRVALMLVPEIALTPQTGGRLIGRFPDQRVAVLHSGLTAAQRHQQWVMASDPGRDGARIILGARSAVFAPIPDDRLGLVIVDEEHDGSYKQDQVPRYHGRDVAIRRAQLSACPIVLGSATPSLESWHNASAGKRGGYELHRLPHRAPGLTLPRVQVVDFREQMRERAHQDKRVHLIGSALEAAIGRTLDAGGQVLLLLNRRGYASYIACPSRICGWTMTCDHCDVTVVYHQDKKLPSVGGAGGGGYVRCHHCLSEQKLPAQCPECGGRISVFGLGVQRVEEELTRTFPQLVEGRTLLRIDSDTMHGSRSFHNALRRFGEGEIKVLLGTQMIAKGLDFPGVKLVGVINADTSINLPDFRAAERTFQLVSQVAGRCGRGADAGLTIVQTFNPTTPAIQLAAKHDFEEFARVELVTRERSGLPPLTRMVRFVVRDEDHVECVRRARDLAHGLEAISQSLGEVRDQKSDVGLQRIADGSVVRAGLRIRGPAPCPISRIADKHRQQVEVIGPSASAIQTLLAAARTSGLIRSRGPRDRRRSHRADVIDHIIVAAVNASLRINEIFFSIQGESTWAGCPCVFVRLTGCHLRCTYCDTAYAFHEGGNRTIDDIITEVNIHACNLVEVTGGEPLLQKNVHLLMKRLCDDGKTVLLETSGACDISVCDPRVIRIMDLKTPGSGEADRNLWSNIAHLNQRDEVKFVITDRADYDWAMRALKDHDIARRVKAVLFSAAFEQAAVPGEIDGCEGCAPRDLAEWLLADAKTLPANVRMQTQMHKLIWDPQTRGV